MKRIFPFVPFVLLAFVVAACQEDSPTVPTVGDPQFAKPDCEIDSSHPACKDDGDAGGDEDYIATDLETRGERVNTSWAFDVSDDLGDGTVAVSGGGKENPGKFLEAMTWTVTGTDVVDGPVILPLDAPDVQDVFAFGISDDGKYIVGRARGDTDSELGFDLVLPVRWDGGPGELLDPVHPYLQAVALDVNNYGETVGWSRAAEGEPRVATLWDTFGTPTELDSPLGGESAAMDINNDGHVVGASWDPVEGLWHAILWPSDGDPCDLDQGVGSVTQAITDVYDDGTVLVAGDAGSPEAYQPAVWQVQVTDNSCSVVQYWTIGGGDLYAKDVRRVGGGWEAVGNDASSDKSRPMVWRFDGTETTETQLAKDGRAHRINSDGRIAGEAKVRRLDHAMLWTPNPNQ